MSHLQPNSRLMSSHSRNSVLFANDQDAEYTSQAQQNKSQKIIFNNSFYLEKELLTMNQKQNNNQSQKQEAFLSLQFQFVKKYFQSNEIQPILTKGFKSVLDTEYLPQNPFNTLYRNMMQQTLIFNVMKYQQLQGKQKRINHNIKINNQTSKKNLNLTKQNMNTSGQQQSLREEQILTKRLIIADKQFITGSKLSKYIHSNAVYTFWTQLHSKLRDNRTKQLLVRNKLQKFFISLGGPAILMLEGTVNAVEREGVTRIGLKVDEPLGMGSYMNETMLQMNYYIVCGEECTQTTQALSRFCQFVTQQCISEMQSNPQQEVYMFLTKLSVNIAKDTLIQWSLQQLIEEKPRIVKQLIKLLATETCQIQASYYMKCTQRMSLNLSQEYITVTKRYILINNSAQKSPQMNITKKASTTQKTTKQNSLIAKERIINSPTPLSSMFEHIFISTDYYELLDQEYQLNSVSNQKIYQVYKREKFIKAVRAQKMHHIIPLSIELFYLSLYDNKLNPQSYHNITDSINTIMNTPLNYLSKSIHQLKTCKLLLNPQFASHNQQQMYTIIQSVDGRLYQEEKKGDDLYPEMYGMLEAVRKLITVILKRQKMKATMVKLILDYIILMLRAIVNSCTTILYGTAQTLHFYLLQLNKPFGTQQTTQHLSSFINFPFYIQSIKHPSSRTLYLPQQTKQLKIEFAISDNEARELLLTKYITKYKLYQQVYQFYWRLIDGRKVKYPMSKFMQEVKRRAVEVDLEIMHVQVEGNMSRGNKESDLLPRGIKVNRIASLQIYEMSQGVNNEFIFYSFNKDSLNYTALPEYSNYIFQSTGKLYQKFSPYFHPTIDNNSSQTLNNKPKHILSLKPLPSLNTLTQQTSGTYLNKLYVDLILNRPVTKPQLYNLLYQQLTQFMEAADKDEIGIIGVFGSWQNLSNQALVYHGDVDEVYSWTGQEGSNVMRFDYKRKLLFQKFLKFLQQCVNQQKQIQIHLLFQSNKVIQSCNITFNCYFKLQGNSSSQQQEQYRSMIDVQCWDERVFYSSKDIVEWGAMNQVVRKKEERENRLREKLTEGKVTSLRKLQQQEKKNDNSGKVLVSMKRILLEQQISVQQILLEDEDELTSFYQSKNNTSKTPLPSTLSLFRQLSPTYTRLQQSHHHLITLIYLITYIKHDRRNRFTLSLMIDQFSLLQYYLMDQCLLNDQFIYFEGLALEVANLLAMVKGFLKEKIDNLGTQGEILWLEKGLYRLAGVVKMMMIGVSVHLRRSMKKVLE